MNNIDCRARVSPPPHRMEHWGQSRGLVTAALAARLPAAGSIVRCGGGGGDREGGIRGDLARRVDRGDCRLHVGGYDVPVAAPPVGADDRERGRSTGRAVRPVSWVSRISPAPAGGSTEPEVWKSDLCAGRLHVFCNDARCECWCHVLYRTLADPHLGAGGPALLLQSQVASLEGFGARVWDLPTRRAFIRGPCSLEVLAPPEAETTGTAVSRRADQAQPRAARLAPIDVGNSGRKGDIRRASQAVVCPRVTAG